VETSLRSAFLDALRGTRDLAVGDLELLLVELRRGFLNLGKIGLLLLMGAGIALASGLFALLFAYVGVARLTGDAFAWTALGFAVLLGGAAGLMVFFGLWRAKKLDLTLQGAREEISAHADLYPEKLVAVGALVGSAVRVGARALMQPTEEIRREARVKIERGIVRRTTGRAEFDERRGEIGAEARVAGAILSGLLVGYLGYGAWRARA
jgi:hypothetical protein